MPPKDIVGKRPLSYPQAFRTEPGLQPLGNFDLGGEEGEGVQFLSQGTALIPCHRLVLSQGPT